MAVKGRAVFEELSLSSNDTSPRTSFFSTSRMSLTDGGVNPFFPVVISLPRGPHHQDAILISSSEGANGVPEIHWPVNILFSNLASASPQLPEVNISQTSRQSHTSLVSWKSVLGRKQTSKLKMGAVDADFVEASNSERVCEILLNLLVNVIRKVITYTVVISQINFFFSLRVQCSHSVFKFK